jgi:tRNA pseudouridine55 synthase
MTHFGVLNVNKPAALSSRDVVNRVERLTRPVRAGHAGTLDPLATGVLVICVGQATRLIQYIQRMPKRYRAKFLLGRHSDTDDVEGDVSEFAGVLPPIPAALEAALPQFIGHIQQRPPSHSAVKVGGRRAYHLARAGKAVELAARTVVIHRLAIVRYEYPELDLDIECGSGTYVRAIGRDLGMVLGTGAVMSALERTAIGDFRVTDAVSLNDLTNDTLPRYLQTALTAVDNVPRVELSGAQLTEIRNGRPIAVPSNSHREKAIPPVANVARTEWQADLDAVSVEEWAAVDASGQLVAILREKRAGELWPVMNFHEMDRLQ